MFTQLDVSPAAQWPAAMADERLLSAAATDIFGGICNEGVDCVFHGAPFLKLDFDAQLYPTPGYKGGLKFQPLIACTGY